jgi:o-succinylbenzoate---CoA ligase
MDWLAAAAATHGDAVAVETRDRTVTYAELNRAANGVASILAASGSIGAGAIGFWGDRSVETIAAVWGIPRAGATAVPVDPGLEPAQAMRLTKRAGVRGLWVTPEGGLSRLVERGVAFDGEPPPEVPYVVFTSGSSGGPKGVRITAGNIAAAVGGSRSRLGNGPADPWLCVLPLFHIGGLSILWRQAESGGRVVLHEQFEPAAVADALGSARFASLVPVMLKKVLAVDQRNWSGLQAVLIGGAGIDGATLANARARGIPALATYGMTETSSQIATQIPGESFDGSVGPVLPAGEIRVVVDGTAVTGVEGRIEARGPMVSPGYIGEPDRSPSQWFVTGDRGVLDADGRLTVLGRADRIIVTGGTNVDPGAVERQLLSHPAIRAARVFGRPDEEWGMRVVAEVETDASPEDLAIWVGEQMTASTRPREWRIVAQIVEKLDT